MDASLDFFEYLRHPFVWRALTVGIFIAVCSSLLGVTLVLRRFSLIGDGLSHVAFGAMAIAAVLKITTPMPVVLLMTIVAAIIILAGGNKTRIKGDAATAMLSVGALSVGYLLMNIFKRSVNISGDVCTTLFGSTSILTLQPFEAYLSIALSVLIILAFIFFCNRIFAITFDEEFARTSGLHAGAGNFIMATVVATVIVLAMNLVGALLVSALIVFPPLISMRVFKSYRSVVVSSAIVAAISATTGILTAVAAETPVGPTIVTVDIILYFSTLFIPHK